MKNLTVRDRCQYGAIAALFGVLVGGAVCTFLLYENPRQPFNRSLLVFSVAYFFFAGFVLGPRAADLVAGAFGTGVQVADYELNGGLPPAPPAKQETIPSDTPTGLVALGYVIAAVALVYFA